jgi:translocation and assembly module TamA
MSSRADPSPDIALRAGPSPEPERTRPLDRQRSAWHAAGWRWALLGLLSFSVASPLRAAAPAEPAVETSIEELELLEEELRGPVVVAIEWRGLETLDAATLEDRIATTAQPRIELRFWRQPPRLDLFTLEDDRGRIQEVYAEKGHFEARASYRLIDPDHPETAFDPEEAERVRVIFEITEGPITRTRLWTLAVAPPGPEPEPIETIERLQAAALAYVAPGHPFGTDLYRERRRALLAWAAEIGFPYARLEGGATVDTESHEARVDWTLFPGPRVRLESIAIKGLERVAPKIVERHLTLETGTRYRGSAIGQSERRLVSTGLFSSVVIQPTNDARAGSSSEGKLALEVDVEESRPRSIRASVGYGTEDGPRGEVILDWRNFMGDARLFRLRGFASFRDTGVEASLGQPWLFGETTRGDLTVSALRQDRPGYEAFVTGAAAFLTWKPSPNHPLTLSVGPGYELSRITQFNTNVDPEERGPRDATIVNLFTRMRFERVDDVIDPSHGFRIELANELGGRVFESDLDYHLWRLDLRSYVGWGPFVLATRGAITTLDPISASRSDVPLTRRLYAGGTNSIRGFGYQRLGPEDANNDPLGGLSRIEAGAELRIRIHKPLAVVGFVDAGDVRSVPWTFRPTELRYSAGPGLRIETPIGPIRLDVGFLLNRPRDADPWRVHLSVGHAF